jgi:hypothetical protein
MPIVENADNTLWIDVENSSEVGAIRARLQELAVPVTILVPDPACGVTVREAHWVDSYPRIVPRNGPEPGITVDPAEIPQAHTLLITVHTMPDATVHRKVVMVLNLIEGSRPPGVAKIITRDGRGPSDLRLRPAKPPPRSG